MEFSCEVIPRSGPIALARSLMFQNGCHGQIRMHNGSPALYCRGKRAGLIGFISNPAEAALYLYKDCELIHIQSNEYGEPYKIYFRV